ncbi:3'-5' exonuclease [Riemerella columbipharyngis]|uniref:DNA polymerase-3 subunit epsilon n=1 Tax=Riemerella columbipharyngis TaxID=1071918 RepID=A0A1G7E5U7_9FLAO|nr:3'-5' exonuclease [Riemerella columbipharyngis]SDE59043.1 DNA polymerase-3 subunit epsilon [Riemerella columbipharyngis]
MFAVLDIESSGGAYGEEHIIEIAVFKYDGHKIVDQFSSIINPQAEISKYVQKLTGITPKMVKTAPKFHEVARRILEITEGTTLVGHNVAFDYRMLKQSFQRLGYDYQKDTLDTIELSKKLLPNEPAYSLGKLAKSLNIPLTERHRAAGDARATLELFRLLMNKDSDNQIIKASTGEDLQKSNYNNKIKKLIENLTLDKGIIYFQDDKGEIIYKSYVDNVYGFATKIFNSTAKRWKKIREECVQIYSEQTSTELIAKLILLSKGFSLVEKLPLGLFWKDDKWQIFPVSEISNGVYLRFRSLSQGEKALRYIAENYPSPSELNRVINKDDESMLLLGGGRTLGEKGFIFIEKNTISGFGFYEFYNQIDSRKKIESRKIKITRNPLALSNELKLSLLKGEWQEKEMVD